MLLKNVICFHLVLEMLIGHSPSLANLSILYVRFIIFIFSLIYIYHKDLYLAANMQGIHHWGLLWKATCFLSRECTLQAGWTELHLFYIGHWVNEYLQVANVLISLEEVSIIIDVVQVILPKSLLQDLKKNAWTFCSSIMIDNHLPHLCQGLGEPGLLKKQLDLLWVILKSFIKAVHLFECASHISSRIALHG